MRKLTAKTKFFNALRLVFRNRLVESVLLPLTEGKSWDSLAGKLPANFYQYPKNSIRKAERNGFKFELDISEYMQWLIYFGIKAEPREKLYELVKPGMVILDIGANIGETSLAFSRLTGDQGKVFAFEPHPGTFSALQKHITLNNCKNIKALKLGLGDSQTWLTLEQMPNNSGGNRITSLPANGVFQVEITTLDKIARMFVLQDVGLIKIDVEGFEYRVLLGGKETITKFRPVLFIELVNEFLSMQGSSTEEVVSFLHSLNYKMENAATGEKIIPRMNFINTHFDIIARPA